MHDDYDDDYDDDDDDDDNDDDNDDDDGNKTFNHPQVRRERKRNIESACKCLPREQPVEKRAQSTEPEIRHDGKIGLID